MQGEIVFDDVSFGYAGEEPRTKDQEPGNDGAAVLGSRPSVLKDISFHARPGETIAIVGQTGSGKSTLTKLVNRTYDASAGRVLVDGVDVRDWSIESLRSQISTIEQDIFLFSRTIAENIAFGARGRATREQIEAAAREAQAHEFIMSFPDGYETVVGERGVTLSGGQRQRTCIARALARDPRILLLDDCLSAVDTETEKALLANLRAAGRGRTVLIAAHRLGTVAGQHGGAVRQRQHLRP